jgi:polyphosphate kinase 2 (PPK2 family)
MAQWIYSEYGITNVGMTARTFFEKRTVYAEISEFDEGLTRSFCILCKYFKEVTTLLGLPRDK